MFCPACGTQNEANALKCVKCGKLLQQVVQHGDEVYVVNFNLQGVDQAVLDSWKTWRPSSFSTPGAILLDIFTCGLFGLIYYGLFFGELPKVSNNDFGAGKGIGFSFIPYFSLYWIFRFWWGLCDRINLQLRLRGQQHLLLPRELATAMCILFLCSIIPYNTLRGNPGWNSRIRLPRNLYRQDAERHEHVGQDLKLAQAVSCRGRGTWMK